MIGNKPLFGSHCSAVATSIVAMALLLLGISCGRKHEGEKIGTAAQTYTVTSYRNNASWSPDDSVWKPLIPELQISSGSWVETGSKSFAVLNGDIGDVVMLGERAKVCLSMESLLQHTGNPLQRGVRLLKGIAHFNIKKGESTFLVETPSAKITVKGTSFLVSYSEDENSTDVQVESGEVEVMEIKDSNATHIMMLSAYEVGSGFGTRSIRKRAYTTRDSALSTEFKEMVQEMQQRTTDDEISRNPDSIRTHLETVITTKTTPTATDSSSGNGNAPKGARGIGSEELRQEKANFHREKQAILEDHEEYKAETRTELEKERGKARSSLEDEKGGRSRSVFDELKKRKEESKQE